MRLLPAHAPADTRTDGQAILIVLVQMPRLRPALNDVGNPPKLGQIKYSEHPLVDCKKTGLA